MAAKQINIKDFVEYEWGETGSEDIVKAFRSENVGLADVPTLIIGIGGTGVTAAKTVKEKVEQHYSSKSAKKLEFLFIDTDAASTAGLNGSDTLIIQSADTAVLLKEYRDNPKCQNPVLSPEITNWLDRCLSPFRVMNGAAGIRQAGRLILFLNINRVIQLLQQKLDKISVGYDLQQTRVKVHIFFGVGGGTGSGMFVDISYIIRELCKNCEIQGFVYMPDVSCMKKGLHEVHKRNIKRNGFAALQEIEQLMTLAPGEPFIQSYSGGTINVNTTYPIFDFCVLIGSKQNGRKRVLSEKEVHNHVAEYLLLELNQKEKNSFDFESFKSNLCADSGTDCCSEEAKANAENSPKDLIEKSTNNNERRKHFSRYASVDADAKYLPTNYFYRWWLGEVFDKIYQWLYSERNEINVEIEKNRKRYWNAHKETIGLIWNKEREATLNRDILKSMKEDKDSSGLPPISYQAKLNYLGKNLDKISDKVEKTYNTKQYLRIKRSRFYKCYKNVVKSDDGFDSVLNRIKGYNQDFTELMTEIRKRCENYKHAKIDNSAFEFAEKAFHRIRQENEYTDSIEKAAGIITDDFLNDPDLWLGRKRTEHGRYLVEHIASIVNTAFEESGCASIGHLMDFSTSAGYSAIQDSFEKGVLDKLFASQLFPIKEGNMALALPNFTAVKILAHSNSERIQCWCENWENKSSAEKISDFPNQMHDRIAMGIYVSGYSLDFYEGMEDFEHEYHRSKSAGLRLFANNYKKWRRDFSVIHKDSPEPSPQPDSQNAPTNDGNGEPS